MKIVHVLSFISADGSYGGPVAVARGQCLELAKRGHDVTLLAGWDRRAALSIPGVDVSLYRAFRPPRLGFGGLTSPGLWRAVSRASRCADAVHVHLARDFAALPATWLAQARCPVIVQSHGMIQPDSRRSTQLVDAVLTRRVLRRSRIALALTDLEATQVPKVARAPISMRPIRNGVRIPDKTASWDGRQIPEVLYCARLHERKRPLDFVRMAHELVSRGVTAKFAIVGPDEGQLSAVLAEIQRFNLGDYVRYEGALAAEQVISRMAASQIYVLPSVNEPFPMSALEAMSTGLPSVLTTSTGISAELRECGDHLVTAPEPAALADAVVNALSSYDQWLRFATAARSTVKRRFSTDAVVDLLEEIYREQSNDD